MGGSEADSDDEYSLDGFDARLLADADDTDDDEVQILSAHGVSGFAGVEYTAAQRGGICGHVFRPGESIYRCRGGCCDCGDPEAWVTEQRCKIHSSHEAPTTECEPLPDWLRERMRTVVATLLDHTLDTLARSPKEPKIKSIEKIRKDAACGLAEEERVLQAYNSANAPALMPETESSMLYACVLWNDETHSFDDVINCVKKALSCPKGAAKQVAEHVDTHGRAIIEESRSLPRLENISKQIAEISLGVHVRSARDTYREEQAGWIISWLVDVTSGRRGRLGARYGAAGLAAIKDAVCQVMCSNWNRSEESANTDTAAGDHGDDDEDEEASSDEESHEHAGYFEAPLSEEELRAFDVALRSNDLSTLSGIDGDVEMSTGEESAIASATEATQEAHAVGVSDANSDDLYDLPQLRKIRGRRDIRWRLDYLLLLDIRLWKETRTLLHELFIVTMMHSQQYKMAMGAIFARNYVYLADAYLNNDRAPETSVMHIAVQLLTTPTIATYLAASHQFFNTVLTLLRLHFLPDSSTDGDNERSIDAHINCNSAAFINRRFTHIFQDMRYMLGSQSSRAVIGRDARGLMNYLELLNLFQGMNPQHRAIDRHVEYESDTWMNAFQVTMLMARCVQPLAQCYAGDSATLASTLRRVLRHVGVWVSEEADGDADADDETHRDRINSGAPEMHAVTLAGCDYQVVKYAVSHQSVSFHHPMHWLLAELMRFVDLLDDEKLQAAGWRSFRNVALGFCQSPSLSVDQVVRTTLQRLQGILDYAVRVCAVIAQIKSGLWVRNGYSIRSQAHHYRDLSLRDAAYDNDIFLVQCGFAILDPSLMLATLLDRFELANWLVDPRQPHHVYDASQAIFMAEEMLHLVILAVSELSRAAKLSEEDEIVREICQATLRPIAYSELTRRVLERSSSHAKFDDILRQLCRFLPPDSINDHGRYELLPEYLPLVDVYYIYYSRNQRSEAEEVLKAYYAKRGEPYVHKPQVRKVSTGPFQRIGNVLHTRALCQVLFSAIWCAMQDPRANTDTLVDEALQLMLLALTDVNNEVALEGGEGAGRKAGFVHHAWTMRFTIKPPPENAAASAEAQNSPPSKREEECSLLELLLRLSVLENFKDHQVKVQYVIDHIGQLGGEQPLAVTAEWRRVRQQAPSSDDREAKRPRPNAKELQAKIMSEFAQAQQSFMDNYAHLMDEDDEDDDDLYGTGAAEADSADKDDGAAEMPTAEEIEAAWQFPAGTCMVCKEETGPDMVYGMLGLVQPSSHVRHTALGDADQMVEVLELPSRLDRDLSEWRTRQAEAGAEGKPWLGRGAPWSRRPGLTISTCGHFVHLRCFESYVAAIQQRQDQQPARNHPEDVSLKEYMCPLCRSLGNMFLPMFGRHKRDRIRRPAQDGIASLDEWLAGYAPALIERICAGGHTQAPAIPSRQSYAATLDANTDFGTQDEAQDDAARLAYDWLRPQSVTNRFRNSVAHMFQDLVQGIISTASISDTDTLVHLRSEEVAELLGHTLNATELDEIRRTFARFAEVTRMTWRHAGIDWFENIPCDKRLAAIDLLADIYGYTICSAEIVARGIGASASATERAAISGNHDVSVIDTIPDATLSLLRHLAEAMATYAELLMQNSSMERTLRGHAVGRLRQISHISADRSEHKSLLHEDLFLILAELAQFSIGKLDVDIWHVMGTLYVAELVKTVVGLAEYVVTFGERAARWINDTRFANWSLSEDEVIASANDASEVEALCSLAKSVLADAGLDDAQIVELFTRIDGPHLFKLVRTFALPFLRRCAILLFTRFAMPLPTAPTAATAEFDRLCAQLSLPSFTELNRVLVGGGKLRDLVRHWCTLHAEQARTTLGHDIDHTILSKAHLSTISLQQPGIYELVPLPTKLDRLFELTMLRTCRKCHQRPTQPALCLVCGVLLCSQGFCCIENGRGECHMHMQNCCGETGIFLLLKRCVLLFLHRNNGSFQTAPYLDIHGEADVGLK
ncbi:hypothetical protein THASP1DRAFT_14054 [Thamnocephalis sphaerospora]|uniref:E3 ubiquitin-protein ligase n=1 Tax=Thamnocephalis sphaerospora TaxID=78915 RepID=A0A4P9XTT2_9FUNG|nr:hypothetical protein THASP1DRAFT_14054 [Thamnocephalis sphaerospora]|eukprot:RKP09604.1 hypothetical protein THASP1DRAFT_14054 [Thamnocephalis sphaerospora]